MCNQLSGRKSTQAVDVKEIMHCGVGDVDQCTKYPFQKHEKC